MTQELLTVEQDQFMPVLSIPQAIARFNTLVTFVHTVMRDGVDFGTIPNTPKPTLLKPGAEKLTTLFGLTTRFVVIEKVEDWTGEQHGGEPFFYYWYRCQLWRGERLIAEADGSCNSRESKYRWRWVGESDIPPSADKTALLKRGGAISEFTFAVDKAETGGKYGKPTEYWQAFRDAIAGGTARAIKKKIKSGEERDAWEIDSTLYRVPNEDIPSQVNTIQKMAQKRALVAAALIGVNASEFFTQDAEDVEIPGSAVYTAPASDLALLDILRAELAAARDRLRGIGGETRPLSKRQVEAMDARALADELGQTLDTAWALAKSKLTERQAPSGYGPTTAEQSELYDEAEAATAEASTR
jgi:hypothetical protein